MDYSNVNHSATLEKTKPPGDKTSRARILTCTKLKSISGFADFNSLSKIGLPTENAREIKPMKPEGKTYYIIALNGRKWVTPREVELMTGRKVGTLRNDRTKHQGLPYIKDEQTGSIYYDIEDVIDYMDRNRVTPVNR